MSSYHPWWQTAVVYQVYPRSFQDTDGDGVGDLPGVTARMGYLADTLGVDAVWLSPFYPSPMADFGYDVADYCDVDPTFGTLDDFDDLVRAAHGHGLKVIVDFVPNHSSDQHAWFEESRSSRESPKRDWYVWRDPAPDGGPPNNWLSIFGGSAWAWDEATEQYYLHSFLHEQPDVNWRTPEVRAAMHDVLRFWMARGVNGFRLDALHFIAKDPEERDNPPNPEEKGGFHKPLGEYDAFLHPYDKGHADIHPWLRDLRRVLDAEGRDVVAIGEVHLYDWTEWATYFGGNDGGAPLDELHMPYNFSLLNTDWSAPAVRAAVDALEAHLPEGGWPNYVLGNHDEPRLASRIGEAQARVAATLLLTLRGTPTLYYGDELGMLEGTIPEEQQQDPWAVRSGRPELSRDGCRTPMAWDASENAGFSPHPSCDFWLPLHPDHERINVAAEREDEASMLNLYRRLLALRRATPALQGGAYRPLDLDGEAVFAFERTDGERRMLVALNFTDRPQHVMLPSGHGGRFLLSTHAGRDGGRVTETLTLGPDEAVVVG